MIKVKKKCNRWREENLSTGVCKHYYPHEWLPLETRTYKQHKDILPHDGYYNEEFHTVKTVYCRFCGLTTEIKID